MMINEMQKKFIVNLSFNSLCENKRKCAKELQTECNYLYKISLKILVKL